MTRHTPLAERVRRLVGTGVVSTSSVIGGDICTATKVHLSDGRYVFVKTRAGAPAGFFEVEAGGLRWLAESREGAATPEVLAYDDSCLVLEWIETGPPTPEAAERLGLALAVTHRSGADRFGADTDGFVGMLPAPNTPTPGWPEFYGHCRIEPYLKAGLQRGALDPADAAAVYDVLRRIDELAGPPEPPARLHGDLWSGNIVWAADGVPRLVDPAAYGGHRETDLAMLALFGAPHLDRIRAAYEEIHPLADGWPDRVGLHQLHPLLVHAVLFGGGYGGRAGATARELLGAGTARTQ